MLTTYTYIEKLRLGLGDTLATTLDEDLIGLELLTRLITALIVTREGNLDRVLLLQTDSILAA